MPSSNKKARVRYHWRLRYDDPLMASEVMEGVGRVCTVWCKRWPKRYEDSWDIRGSAFGFLDVWMTCISNDQWYCHKWSQKFAKALAVRSRVTIEQVLDPDPEGMHRGRLKEATNAYNISDEDLRRLVPWQPAPKSL